MLKKIILVIIFSAVTILGGIPVAQGKGRSPGNIEDPNDSVREIRRQMIEMQKKHDAEIDALKEQIDKIVAGNKELQSKSQIESLRELARAEALKETAAEKKPEEKVFKSGSLGLQALNPEISVTGDFLFSSGKDRTNEHNNDFNFRNLGVHTEAWLDPYTHFKGALEFHEDETELGEAYVTLYNIRDDLNLTLGKFRQQFGFVNRWHKHGLDQVDFPLALRKIFGEGGLNQSGLSLDWLMPPVGNATQQLTFQLTDGSNDRLFGQNRRNRPSFLAHYKNYRDISKDTYLEWGLTGLMGWNNRWELAGDTEQSDSMITTALGADLSVLWEPTEKMRYRNVEWHSEVYMLNKRLLAPDNSGTDNINAWGLYSYLQSKLSQTIEMGVRGDYYVPDTKSYAEISDSLSLSPLAVTSDSPHICQVGPYITWWQSPFVKFRIEYDYGNGKGIDSPEHLVWLQCVFAAGPHKHERY
jgi:hypothetical protein